MEGRYLITTDCWFMGPDGLQYKAVWGEVQVVGDSILRIKTNRQSTNWFLKVGTDDNHVIIAGCQIHYAIRCEEEPNSGLTKDWTTNNGKIEYYDSPCATYFAK